MAKGRNQNFGDFVGYFEKWHFLGNLLKELGYFLFQHLVGHTEQRCNIISDSKILPKLNFKSCNELKSHGVSITGYFKIANVLTYCNTWSE